MKRLPLGVLLLFSLFFASVSTAFLGNVVSILDGDTIEVRATNTPNVSA
jgi:hypothetical protein